MMRAASLSLLLVTTACASTSNGASSASAADVDQEVRALLKTQADDWTAGDLEGFCAVYADDALFLSPSGETRGRAEIVARYHKRYREGGAEMGALTLEVVEVKSEGPDHASAALRWRLVFKAREPASGLSLVVLRRTAGGWRIVQDASM